MGNRIGKIDKPRVGVGAGTELSWKYTWYTLDAQGQTLATNYMDYDELVSGSTYQANYQTQEEYIYGSSRLGVLNTETTLPVNSRQFTSSGYDDDGRFIINQWSTEPIHPFGCMEHCDYPGSRTLGSKQYELTDHLGNVLATISDLKYYDDVTDHCFEAKVVSCQDYYPFGMLMPNRQESELNYRFGFNGQEMDNEVSGIGNTTTAMFWEYDTRLMRRWNRDPITYPWNSPYQVFNGNPIVFADPLGLYGDPKTAEKMRKRAIRAGLNPSEVHYDKNQKNKLLQYSFDVGGVDKDGIYVVCYRTQTHFGSGVSVFYTNLPDPNLPKGSFFGVIPNLADAPTHSFIDVWVNGKSKYYAYGPKNNNAINDQLVKQEYNQDLQIIDGNPNMDKNIKAEWYVSPPSGMTEEEFARKVISVAESFGEREGMRYCLYPAGQNRGNCNTSTTTILVKSGVSIDKILLVRTMYLHGNVNWGVGIVRPWTNNEQYDAIEKIEQDYEQQRKDAQHNMENNFFFQ